MPLEDRQLPQWDTKSLEPRAGRGPASDGGCEFEAKYHEPTSITAHLLMLRHARYSFDYLFLNLKL